MKIASQIIVILLALLALASGVAKILLMPQDVEFFAAYGLGSTALMVFGAAQLLGAVLMVIGRTRLVGAMLVAVTFLVSGVLLLHAGQLPMGLVTLAVTGLLCVVAFKASRTSHSSFS